MNILEKMERFLQTSLEVEDPRGLVCEARMVLAQAVVDKQAVDEKQLEQLAIRFGNALRGRGVFGLMAGYTLLGACEDYMCFGQVCLPDRIATEEGWTYVDGSST